MNKFFLTLIILLIAQQLSAQFKQNTKGDYSWAFGYGYAMDQNDWYYNFNKQPLEYFLKYKLLKALDVTANICDKNGDIVFYTNACKISDADNQVIQGGDIINNSLYYTGICNPGYGGRPHQGIVILPSMTDDTTYYMFHLRVNLYFDSRLGTSGTDRLLLSKIIRDSSKYKIVFKDSILLDYKKDSVLMDGQLTACRHANGRDWWIMMPKLFEKDYHLLLFSPKGVEKKLIKNIGENRILFESGSGMSIFSPDGTKYIRYNFLTDAQIFDFDRCTGRLSNFKHIPIQDAADSIWGAGCAISPNSRFLYLASSTKLYQYDLWSDSIETTKYTFNVDSNFVDRTQGLPLYTLFYTCQLGPDGKIYITSTGARKYMHVIEHPDLKGAACDLRQNAITLPVYISWAIPFFPNYRLGALTGSPCDTLSSTATHDILPQGRLKIYPNPAHDILKVDMTIDDYGELKTCQLRIIDIIGRVQQTYPLSNFASVKEISVASLVNGLYFVELVNGQGLVLAKSKIVVSK